MRKNSVQSGYVHLRLFFQLCSICSTPGTKHFISSCNQAGLRWNLLLRLNEFFFISGWCQQLGWFLLACARKKKLVKLRWLSGFVLIFPLIGLYHFIQARLWWNLSLRFNEFFFISGWCQKKDWFLVECVRIRKNSLNYDNWPIPLHSSQITMKTCHVLTSFLQRNKIPIKMQ